MKKLCFLMALSSVFMFCNEIPPVTPTVTCTPIDDPDATRQIQVTYPKANDTLRIDQAVKIKVKVEQVGGVDRITNLVPAVFVDKVKKIISTSGHAVVSSGSVTCLEIPWTIGYENETVTYKDTNLVTVKVYNYGEESIFYYTSKPFVIVK